MVTQIGRYDILRTLRSGAASTVYLGRAADADRLVTIAILGDAQPSAEARSGFLREPTMAARVRHPNVIAVVEIGDHDGHPFFAMEYVAGESLDALLRRSAPPPLVERLSLIEQLCGGLAGIHAAGVVHGHIKPSNLLMAPDGVLKICNFSIARLTGESPGVLGTVNYIAPELARGQSVDHRIDIFAAGAVLYEAISLERAFPDVSDGLLERLAHRRPVPLAERVADVDPALVRIVNRALDPVPDNRYPGADEMRRDIALVRRRLSGAGTDPFASPAVVPAIVGGAPGPAAVPPVSLDEVQFTVYRPKSVRPQARYPMLVFTHLGDREEDSKDERTPLEQVRDHARKRLGPDARIFRDTTSDAKHGVPPGGEITLIPDVPGIEFTPSRQMFTWKDDVHEHRFEFEAGVELDGQVARGRLAAYLGVLLLAEVDLAIGVDSSLSERGAVEPSGKNTARAYRKIFASYSRRDKAVVEQIEQYVQTLGDRYLRDIRDLRAGEKWQEGLLRLIDEADVFQLFWSSNAMHSPNVRREWEYALSLNRPSFVRPTYWEVPLPEAPEEGLPPETLRQLHFHRLGVRELPALTSAKSSSDEDTSQLRILEAERARLRERLDHLALHREAARWALSANELDAAAEACDAMLSLAPDDGTARELLAEIEHARRRRAEREERAERARPDAAAPPPSEPAMPTLVRPDRRGRPEPLRPDPARAPVEVDPPRRSAPTLGRSGYIAAAASIVLAIAVGTLVLRDVGLEPPPASEVNEPRPSDVPLPQTTLPSPPKSPVPAPSPSARGNTPPPPTAVFPTPPTRQPTGADAERAAIRELLNRYVAAYRSMDEAAIRGIDPGFRGLARRPDERVVDLQLSDLRIALDAKEASAVVRARRSVSYSRRAPAPLEPRVVTDDVQWTLRKDGSGWRVVP